MHLKAIVVQFEINLLLTATIGLAHQTYRTHIDFTHIDIQVNDGATHVLGGSVCKYTRYYNTDTQPLPLLPCLMPSLWLLLGVCLYVVHVHDVVGID